MGIVYIATNRNSGKSYIGYTTHTLEWRRYGHERAARLGSTLAFAAAIRQDGPENFVWEVLAESNDKPTLETIEIKMIGYWNTHIPNGYNLTWGGGSGYTRDHKFSDEHKAKISKAIRESWNDGRRSRAMSDEQKEKIAESMRHKRGPYKIVKIPCPVCGKLIARSQMRSHLTIH